MKCPYCGNGITEKIEHKNLSFKRRRILEFIINGGAAGVKVDEVKKRFFHGKSDNVLRSISHYINQDIMPSQIVRKGGVIKVVRRD